MKKFLKVLLWIVITLVAAVALFFGYLTVKEYKPADVESVDVVNGYGSAISLEGEHSILTWNVGYCALSKDTDFIMDGGGNAPVADKETVEANIDGIRSVIEGEAPDIAILQEVDTCSSRSYRIDQREYFSLGAEAHALNYSCEFVPFPMPPIAKVNSGVFTTTPYAVESADRYSLPCPFTWPLRIANLKRCLMASYLPIEGSDSKLVIVNFHLEAYDSGEGKIAQTKQLMEFVQQEYEKGNYVIAGGDWNQTFPGSLDIYPNTHEDLWAVGLIEDKTIPEGWTLAYDTASPTCRLLNQPYNPEDTENTQYYVIDGFLCSPNVKVSAVTTLDRNFEYADHNPVRLDFSLVK